jgi:beta-lactamase class A
MKYLLVFLIPAALGIYLGFGRGSSPKSAGGYVETPDIPDVVQEQDVQGESTNVSKSTFSELRDLMKGTKGTYSLYIKDLQTNVVNDYNSDLFYNTASVFKIYMAVSVMKNIEQKNINMDFYYKITSADYEGGTGVLQYESVGSRYKVSELLDLAMRKSDNVAQNILIRAIGKNYINDDTFSIDNDSSARKIGVFLENFYENKYITKESRDYLLALMEETDFDDRINLGLSSGTTFAHKIGNWPNLNSWHDCGIATKGSKSAVVCLLSKNTSYNDYLVIAKHVGQYTDSSL